MSSSRMLVVLIVVAAAVGALIYWYGAYPANLRIPVIEGLNNSNQNQSFDSNTAGDSQVSSPEEISLPEAGGNVDSVVDAIIKGASVDQAAALSEDSENGVLNSDSGDIADFGQTYNENNY